MDSLRCLCVLLLCLSVVTAPNIRTLNTLEELRDNNIQFGKTYPRHGLKLLHWLARILQVLDNNVMLVGDYANTYQCGFNRFNRFEAILPHHPNSLLCEVGNLNTNSHPGSRQLPRHVTEDFYNSRQNQNRNRDRVILQILTGHPHSVVKNVYITEHSLNQKSFSVSNTFEISPQLLRDIQNIMTEEEFLTQVGYDFNSRNMAMLSMFQCFWPSRGWSGKASCPLDLECDTDEVMRLEVHTSERAYARITWGGIPKTILSKPLALKFYANMDSSDELYSCNVGSQQSGSIDTTVLLHPGLQVRLMETYRLSSDKEIWATPEFDEAYGRLPSEVSGYKASLQLFVKEGKACARLYIHKSFTDWRTKFYSSWVGFYKSAEDRHGIHPQYQWATKFTENKNEHTDTHDAYEYQSSLDIEPGFQIRFFLQDYYMLSQTVPWGGEMAIRRVITSIKGHDASLHLYASGGKACARLYIKKSFTDWDEKFYYAWVGIYGRSSDQSNNRITYQWAIYFEQNTYKNTVEYMAFDYDFGIDLSPGLEVRFFPSKSNSDSLARIPFFYY